MPTLVNAPFAGHRAMIADYHKGQSLVETLLAGGVGHVALTDWKSATDDIDFEIDNFYLEELIVAIDDLGGRVISSGSAGRLVLGDGGGAFSRQGERARSRRVADRHGRRRRRDQAHGS